MIFEIEAERNLASLVVQHIPMVSWEVIPAETTKSLSQSSLFLDKCRNIDIVNEVKVIIVGKRTLQKGFS